MQQSEFQIVNGWQPTELSPGETQVPFLVLPLDRMIAVIKRSLIRVRLRPLQVFYGVVKGVEGILA
jgi:hypothetical protein